MKSEIKTFLAILGLFCCQLQASAQRPNFAGSWHVNLEKSRLAHKANGLTGSVFIIKQSGDMFCLTRYHLFGAKRKRISFKMEADGKTRRVKILFKAKLVWKENSLHSTLWRRNFSNIVQYTLGSNQNELIADEVFSSRVNNHHNIWIFDREVPHPEK